MSLESQTKVDQKENKAFREGIFHTAYGLIVEAVLSMLIIVMMLRYVTAPVYVVVVVLASVVIFAFSIAVLSDLWAHGYSH